MSENEKRAREIMKDFNNTLTESDFNLTVDEITEALDEVEARGRKISWPTIEEFDAWLEDEMITPSRDECYFWLRERVEGKE